MSPEQEEMRGEDARRILAEPLLQEAYQMIEEKIVSHLKLAALDAEKRKSLNDLLIAHAKHKQYLEQVIVSGTLAATELDRKRSLADRVLRRA